MSASKKLQAAEARSFLKRAEVLFASKGKETVRIDLKKVDSKLALPHLLGPTGNLRAPTLIVGDVVLVGFNQEVFLKVLV